MEGGSVGQLVNKSQDISIFFLYLQELTPNKNNQLQETEVPCTDL